MLIITEKNLHHYVRILCSLPESKLNMLKTLELQ